MRKLTIIGHRFLQWSDVEVGSGISRLTRLTHLFVALAQIIDVSLPHIVSMNSDLGWIAKLNGVSMSHFGGLTMLQTLSLQDVRMDGNLESLSGLTALASL